MRRTALLLLLTMVASMAFSQTEQVLRIGYGPYDIQLNPYLALYSHEMQIFTGLYEGLFAYHPETLDPLPAQAESFRRSADGKTYTFTLRPDLRWADGSRVSSEDYVQSWRYLLAPETRADFAVFFDIIEGAREFRTGMSKNPESVGIKALDARTLQVQLKAPAAYFTRLLCHSSFVPVHQSLRYKADWPPESVIGNGPYSLAAKNEQEMQLEKSDSYWDRNRVAIEEIVILFLDSEEEATRRFNTGEIHWLSDMMDVDFLTLNEGIQYSAMFATSYYYWNCREEPWNDARIRRALALLVPWQIIRTKDNYYSPSDKLVLPFSGYTAAEGVDRQNIVEALELLTEAGYADPSKLPPLVLLLPDNSLQQSNAAILQRAWAEQGISADLQFVPGSQFSRVARSRDYTISFSNWIGDFADPAAFLLMWTSQSTLNEGSYRNSEYDRLIDESMNQEGSSRLETLARAETLLLQEAAVMPTNHMPSFNLVDTEALRGWYTNPLDVHPLKDLYFGTIREPGLLAQLGK
ncbi:MAG: peptide ABC transporter substrate-binding protein [Spirochaetes bacterium]|nr:peptide ABC transporter substrate-binding protein [Spirochaetota bacterium]